jgi:nitroreductase
MPGNIAEAILGRHSVREGFDGRALEREHLEEIVACGLAAPSSKAAQPWRFHVATDRAFLARIAGLVLAAERADDYMPKDPATGRPRIGLVSTVAESADILRSASVAIFVENLGAFSTSRRAVANSPSDVREDVLLGYAFELIGIGAAVENMWLAAHALGIEGVFMGDLLIAEDKIRAMLQIENDLAGALVLGTTTAPQSSSAGERLDQDRATTKRGPHELPEAKDEGSGVVELDRVVWLPR